MIAENEVAIGTILKDIIEDKCDQLNGSSEWAE